jgi:hypothetical protein
LEIFWRPLRPQNLNVAKSASLFNDFGEKFPKRLFERLATHFQTLQWCKILQHKKMLMGTYSFNEMAKFCHKINHIVEPRIKF